MKKYNKQDKHWAGNTSDEETENENTEEAKAMYEKQSAMKAVRTAVRKIELTLAL